MGRTPRGGGRGLDKRVKGVVKFDEPLKKHTSLRVGGGARYFVVPASYEDIRESLSFAEGEGLPWVVLGNGTNILFPDEGYPGVVLKVGPLLRESRLDLGKGSFWVQAGESLGGAIEHLHAHGLGDFDFLVGIPGTIGGALVMNAGIPEGTISELVRWVRAIDEKGDLITLGRAQCEFGYRESLFQREKLVIVEAEFTVGGERRWDLAELLERRRRQPLGQPSPGCVFKNPPGWSAGELIDRAGLKGYRIGGAMISPVHANFIVNVGGARANDILRLIDLVRERVHRVFGIELEPELEIVCSRA